MTRSPDREVAFVTGAAQGIGLAVARCLAQDGFSVIAMDRSAEILPAAVAGLVAEGLAVAASWWMCATGPAFRRRSRGPNGWT